ncbi:MAG TPA: MFS transporter [Stellaceae bacterium]|jgi:AAHS family 4-hydroxybenzoate transporter-like MFS transporter|nr:MFS transporter [Stellaceae bacterium]
MATAQTIDINATIERIGLRRLGIFVVILAFLMMMADGYDFGTLSLAAPSILKEWKANPKELGAVFSITFFGLLVGSLLYGWIADRFGRRFTIIFGVFNFGIPILLTVWAANVTQLAVLRFVGGIGMGGIVPIAYTLVSEYAPRRMRSTVTVITNAGYNVGAALGGLIAAASIPVYGWQSLYVIGAVFSLAMALLMIAYLPDSLLFLVLKKPASSRIRPLAARLLAPESIPPDTRFVAIDLHEDQDKVSRAGFVRLFTGRRSYATTLLWLLFISDALGFFFLASWLPVVMTNAGVAGSTASLMASLFVFAGLIGGFLIMRFLDGVGPIAFIALPIIGGPTEIVMGIHGLPQTWLLIAIAIAGICLAGIHMAVYAIAVRFYPPSIRGVGISMATVWGRAGGIVAPYVGGYLLAAHMPLQQLMYWAALPCLTTTLIGIGLGVLYRRHFDEPATIRVAARTAA